MLYEFIATLTAGLGFAGVALLLGHLLKLGQKKAPKWLIPIFAGIGMLGFQIHQEYHWFAWQSQQLPQTTKILKTITESTWYRPWSYIKPQIVRFSAIDLSKTQTHPTDPNLHLAQIYLFERRMSPQNVLQVINCQKIARADPIPSNLLQPEYDWIALDKTDPLITQVCQPPKPSH